MAGSLASDGRLSLYLQTICVDKFIVLSFSSKSCKNRFCVVTTLELDIIVYSSFLAVDGINYANYACLM